jgi:hypothetical protein
MTTSTLTVVLRGKFRPLVSVSIKFCIPFKNTVGGSAVVSCACELILLVCVLCSGDQSPPSDSGTVVSFIFSSQ